MAFYLTVIIRLKGQERVIVLLRLH